MTTGIRPMVESPATSRAAPPRSAARPGGAPSPRRDEPHGALGGPRRQSFAYLGLTFLISWLAWGAILATTGDPEASPTSFALWTIGGLGPAIAAALVAAGAGGGQLRALVGSVLRWRIGGWYALVLAPLPVATVAVFAAVVFGDARLDPAGLSQWALLPLFFVGGIAFGGLEEIGWRGYLQPRLQDRSSVWAASVTIGLVWALWHAPLFLMVNTSQAQTSMVWFTVQAVALSVVLGWAFDRSRSTLLVILVHGAGNASYSAAVQWLAPTADSDFMPYAALIITVIAVALLWQGRRPHA